MLTCSGKSRTANLGCFTPATWAVRRRDGATWHGACFHHSHQVMKRASGKENAELVVAPARVAVDELMAMRSRLRIEADKDDFLAVLRPHLQDSGERWSGPRVAELLRSRGLKLTDDQGTELLEFLCDERVMEATGDGRYVASGVLAQ